MAHKVTIYTQVYKTEPFLAQCIESVIAQTYTNWEYILVDNASPDRCGEIIDHYAALDNRIKPIHLTENQGARSTLTKQYGCGYYYTVIDSDDWWDVDYLERLVNFLERNDLDLAVTGTVTHREADNSDCVMRQLSEPVVLTCQQFAQRYPQLWAFPSTVWGILMKMDLYLLSDGTNVRGYGSDTIATLNYIKRCKRLGIDNSAMYHYRIHPKSVSYQYDSRRFDANIVYYEVIRDFLEQHNAFDWQKRSWLKIVHLTSMIKTLHLLTESDTPVLEKLAECVRIAEHPLTQHVLTAECDQRETWCEKMRIIVTRAIGQISSAAEEEQARTILKCIAPDTLNAFSLDYRMLYVKEPPFWVALMKNEREKALLMVVDWIAQGRYVEQFDLCELVNSLIPDRFLLKGEHDLQFFKTYAESCRLILSNSLDSALDQMTGILLENETLYAEERFLKLYLPIAALRNQIPAYLYGNTRLAILYFREGRFDESRELLSDLEEMGAGENADVLALKTALEELR